MVESTINEVNLLKYFLLLLSLVVKLLQRQLYIFSGSILLNALMKQPIVPGSVLGLCHLLSSNSETLQGAMLQSNLLDT